MISVTAHLHTQNTRGAGRHRAPGDSIGGLLDARRNGLNLLRLIMASGVILYHAFPLSGTRIPTGQLFQWLDNGWVDGFFVISGFLITGAWIRRPRAWPFLKNRLLRIYPAFVVCLVLTAFVFAPVGAVLAGEQLRLPDQVLYVVSNLGLNIRDFSIGDTLASVPYARVWNGSLWTLFFEFLCYLAVLAAGLLGGLKTKWVIPATFAGAWILQLAVTLRPALADVHVPIVMHRIASVPLDLLARFALTFAAGALVYQFRDRLPCTWRLVGLAAFGVLVSLWMPQYRLVAAPLLAYGLIAAGALIKGRRLVLDNDISYGIYIYAFPIQQLLVVSGWHRWGYVPYVLATLCLTVALAICSWVAVEKPALSLKARTRRLKTESPRRSTRRGPSRRHLSLPRPHPERVQMSQCLGSKVRSDRPSGAPR